jgi:hypothetical protein
MKCSGCGTVSRIVADSEGALSLRSAPAAAPAEPEPRAPATDCPHCGASVTTSSRFCTSCGKALGEQSEGEEGDAEKIGPATARRRKGGRAEAARKKNIGKARVWIGVLAAVFIVAGTVQGIAATSEAERLDRALTGQYEDTDVVEDDDGKEWVIGDLRGQIKREALLVFVVNYILAAVMIGVFFWAKSSPFPATITALCVYLVVQVLNAIAEPASLVQGFLWKAFIIVALVAGVRSALAERVVRRPRLAASSR